MSRRQQDNSACYAKNKEQVKDAERGTRELEGLCSNSRRTSWWLIPKVVRSDWVRDIFKANQTCFPERWIDVGCERKRGVNVEVDIN